MDTQQTKQEMQDEINRLNEKLRKMWDEEQYEERKKALEKFVALDKKDSIDANDLSFLCENSAKCSLDYSVSKKGMHKMHTELASVFVYIHDDNLFIEKDLSYTNDGEEIVDDGGLSIIQDIKGLNISFCLCRDESILPIGYVIITDKTGLFCIELGFTLNTKNKEYNRRM